MVLILSEGYPKCVLSSLLGTLISGFSGTETLEKEKKTSPVYVEGLNVQLCPCVHFVSSAFC